jgi:nucleoside-diphosphate-sugar epimerase
LIGRVYGWDGKVIIMSKDKLPQKIHADFRAEQDLTVDTSRIRHELGYTEKVPTREALKTTIAWELENPPANINPEDYDYEAEDKILKNIRGIG